MRNWRRTLAETVGKDGRVRRGIGKWRAIGNMEGRCPGLESRGHAAAAGRVSERRLAATAGAGCAGEDRPTVTALAMALAATGHALARTARALVAIQNLSGQGRQRRDTKQQGQQDHCAMAQPARTTMELKHPLLGRISQAMGGFRAGAGPHIVCHPMLRVRVGRHHRLAPLKIHSNHQRVEIGPQPREQRPLHEECRRTVRCALGHVVQRQRDLANGLQGHFTSL